MMPNTHTSTPRRRTRLVPQGDAMWQVQVYNTRSCCWVNYGTSVLRCQVGNVLEKCLQGFGVVA
jgi:hypothetical protein